MFIFDDDSNTSDPAQSPSHGDESGLSDIGSPPIIPQAPSPPNLNKGQKLFHTSNFQANVAKLPVVTTQTFTLSNTPNVLNNGGNYSIAQVKNGNNFVTKVRPKKSNRPKPQSKSKVIKFHEYKGPPNVVKSTNPTSSATTQDKSETPYHILLQQQQLYLQWQLEFNGSNNITVNKIDKPVPSVVITTASTSPITVTSPVSMTTSQGQMPSLAVTQAMTSPPSQSLLGSQGSIITTVSAPPNIQTKIMPPAVVQTSTSPICQPQVQLNPNKPITTKIIQNKPLSNLEDMKVADLKAELKKRNLPVSGPKPQLIERLKPYADTIIPNINSSSKNISALSKLPVQAVVNVKKFPVVKSDDISMHNSSSPTSPRSLESFMPLSPEIMEMVTSPQASSLNVQQQNNINASQGSIPMAIDNSRPPSVAPLDIAMEVDQPPDPSNIIQQSFNQSNLSPSSSTITLVTSPTQQQVQLIQTPMDQGQPHTIQMVAPKVPQLPVTNKIVEPASPEQLLNQEMLQQQRHKISELQRQLEESQMRLKLQQIHHQHLQKQQQQLNKLQQQTAQLNQIQQTHLLQQPNSPPMPVSSQMLQQQVSPSVVVNSTLSPQQNTVTPPLTAKTNMIQPTSPPQAVGTVIGNPPTQILPLPVSQAASEGTTILQIPLNALQNATRLTTADALKAVNASIKPPASTINTVNGQAPKVSMPNILGNQVLHHSLNLGNPTTSLSSLINIQSLQTQSGKPINGLTSVQQQR